MPAIHHDQLQMSGASSGRSHARRRVRHPSTFNHKPVSAAHMATSQPRCQLGRGFGSGRFIRVGWTGGLNEIADVRRLIASGLDERVAALTVEADQSSAPGLLKGIPERLPTHFRTSVSNASDRSDGAAGIVPVRTGELPAQRGERQHVLSS